MRTPTRDLPFRFSWFSHVVGFSKSTRTVLRMILPRLNLQLSPANDGESSPSFGPHGKKRRYIKCHYRRIHLRVV